MIDHTKEIASGPNPVGGGNYQVEYLITVSNLSPTAGVYDLDDQFLFGEPFTIVGDPTVSPAAPDFAWDPATTTLVVAVDEPIAGSTSIAYSVLVTFTIDPALVTPENSDCTLDPGETTTGLANTATLTVNGVETPAEACPVPPPTVTHDKTVSSGPTEQGDGTYVVEYTITVENHSAGAGPYDLTDALLFGPSVTIVGTPTITNTVPGGITPLAGWNGTSDTLVVDDQNIDAAAAAGPEVHEYVVSVTFEVDALATTFTNSDCTLDPGEPGTGLLNESTVTVNGVADPAEACPDPPATPVPDKEATAGPTALGNGDYEIEYTITVTNAAAGAGVYDLDDVLRFGAGITVVGAPVVENVTPGGIAVNPAWDGVGDTRVASAVPIDAGTASGPTTHTYRVTVVGHVPPDISSEAADCEVGPGEPGSGFLNVAIVGNNGTNLEAEACEPASAFDPFKTLVSVQSNGNGQYTLTYQLTVTHIGPDTTYDLEDQFLFSPAVTVQSISTTTSPAGIVLNPGFNGVTNTLLADDVPISDGGVHLYTMAVVVSAPAGAVTAANADCSLAAGEAGTGFFNVMSVNSNGQTFEDDACAELAPPAPAPPAPVTPGPVPVTG